MSFKSFLQSNAIPPENKKFPLSQRFLCEDGKPELWELRAISEEENKELKATCTSKVFVKGRQETRFDPVRYTALLIATSVVYPDLKNAELQKSYKVVGEVALLGAMLTAGEYNNLTSLVQEICGFDVTIEEQKEEVKNS